MILMGDEVRRTQEGNNNAYDQDNEISWMNWDLVGKNSDLLRFVCQLIRFHQHSCLFRDRNYWGSIESAEINFHGVRLDHPDWAYHSHSLAFELHNHVCKEHLHVMLNAYWKPLDFELPNLPVNETWQRLLDTTLPSPEDICESPVKLPGGQKYYRLGPRSVAVLVAGTL
jgi:glycogen operon protein